MIGSGLDEQLEKFVREHSDTKLIIVDTLPLTVMWYNLTNDLGEYVERQRE